MKKERRIMARELLNSKRGEYIIGQALCRALEVMEQDPFPEYSNIEDMKLLMEEIFPIYWVCKKADDEYRKKQMDNMLFRKLDDEEEESFRQWARENYRVGSDINTVWHPVVRDECIKMNEEADSEINESKGR